MLRVIHRRLMALGLLGALGLALAGCHRGPDPGELADMPTLTVGTAIVATGMHRATEEVVGTVRSRIRAAIEAKVSGRIEKMQAVPGQVVEAGDLLVELDVREIRAKVEQARAILQQSEQEYDRIAALFKQEAMTRAEFESVEARRRVARAAVVEAETVAEYSRITAPFRGVVTRKLADAGDLAVPGRTLLELEDPQALRFEADVPSTLVEWVRLGQELSVELVSRAEPVTAKVVEIEPSADPVSRTFRIRLDLPEGTDARTGWFGRLRLPLEETPVTTVPTNAVTVRGQMEYVWVAVDGRARLRIVKTGKRLASAFTILSGLATGERVVVEGAEELRDGQAVVTR